MHHYPSALLRALALALVLAAAAQTSPRRAEGHPVVPLRPRSPLTQADRSEIRRVRIQGPHQAPEELLMHLGRSTQDEIHATLEALRRLAAHVPPGTPPVRLRVIPESRTVLEDFRVSDPELLEFLRIEDYEADDMWLQDWGLLAEIQRGAEGALRPAVLHTGRRRTLSTYPERLARRTRAVLVRASDEDTSGNYGGNFLVTPGDHLVIGDTVAPDLLAFLRRAGYRERTALLPVGWLEVGHVDEVVSLIPAPQTPLGFVMAYASPRLALEELANLSGSARAAGLRALDQVIEGDSHSPADVREEDEETLARCRASLLALHRWQLARHAGLAPAPSEDVESLVFGGEASDPGEALEAVNLWVAKRIARARGELRAAIRRWYGPEASVPEVPLPALFEMSESGYALASLPNPVNLQILGEDLLVPDPLVPELRQATRRALGSLGFRVHLIPSLTFHAGVGQLHCATKVLRSPGRASASEDQAPLSSASS